MPRPAQTTPPPLRDVADRRFRALQEAVPQVSWTATVSGDVLEDSPGWRELTGQSEQQLLAPLGWLDAVHPDDRDRTRDTFVEAAAQGRTWASEHRLRLRDGTFSRFRARGAAVVDDEGVPLEMVVVHAPTSDTSDAERERILLREVVRQMPAGVVVRGKDGSLLFANEQLRQIAGDLDRPHEVRRLDGATLLPSEWPLRRALLRGEVVVGERVRYSSPTRGEVTVVLSAAPVRDSSGEIFAAVGTLQQESASDSEIRRVAAFTEELLAIVGHDLRDPLNAILLGAALLRMGELTDEQRKQVTRIASAGERGVRMLEALLDFTQARIGGGIQLRRAEMDLAQLCRELASEQERILVEVAASGDCTGSWDCSRLEQLIGNLLRNAAEHGAADQPVELSCAGYEDHVVLTVRNSGSPIDPALMPTLFEPFKRGARASASRNLGLGLYIVRQIAQAHGGSVEARSSPEDGTEFRVVLPR